MKESHLQKPAEVYAKARGWFTRRVKWAGRRGAPDNVFVKDGRTVWIEFKREDGKGEVAAAQINERKRLLASGAEAYIVEDWDDFVRILDGPL